MGGITDRTAGVPNMGQGGNDMAKGRRERKGDRTMKHSVSELLSKMPLEVKERLLKIADRLPKHQAKVFLSEAVKRFGAVCRDYECTIGYGIIGYLLGCVLDALPLVPHEVRVICLLLGAAYGLREDVKRRSGFGRDDLTERLIEALIEALRAAQAAGSGPRYANAGLN